MGSKVLVVVPGVALALFSAACGDSDPDVATGTEVASPVDAPVQDDGAPRAEGSNGLTISDVPIAEFVPELLDTPLGEDSGLVCPPDDSINSTEVTFEANGNITGFGLYASATEAAAAVVARVDDPSVERDRADNAVRFLETASEAGEHPRFDETVVVVIPWVPGDADGRLLARLDIHRAGDAYLAGSFDLCESLRYTPVKFEPEPEPTDEP